MLNNYLCTLSSGQHLTREEAHGLSSALISPGHHPAMVGAILTALRIKGETADEICGFVTGLKAHAVKIQTPPGDVFDVAGTGGDGAHTQNISTLTALILSGAGITIAKHGNRSVSSSCGSADVLHACGVNINTAPENIARQLREGGMGFIYAPLAHPAMKNVMESRKALRMPSIFNLAGPLSNPVTLAGQAVGVYSSELTGKMADVMVKLGMSCGVVIHGHGGLDEASLSGPNTVIFIEEGRTVSARICAKDLGLKEAPVSMLRGGSPTANARSMTAVLNGAPGAYRDAALLNSAIALYGFGKASSLAEALQTARESLDSSRALDCLNRLKDLSHIREAI